MNRTTRVFNIPRGLSATAFDCSPVDTNTPATCLDHAKTPPHATREPSYLGTYQPGLYVLSGVAMRPVHTARAALMIDRAVTAVLCLGLLGVAAWLLVGGSPAVLVGLAVANRCLKVQCWSA